MKGCPGRGEHVRKCARRRLNLHWHGCAEKRPFQERGLSLAITEILLRDRPPVEFPIAVQIRRVVALVNLVRARKLSNEPAVRGRPLDEIISNRIKPMVPNGRPPGPSLPNYTPRC